LCDNYSDDSSIERIFNIDIPASTAFHRSGAICRRSPLDWAPVRTATMPSVRRSYLRTVVHTIDWASFVPELVALEPSDKELLLASRIIPCAWLTRCHRSAVYKTKGVAICGGDYHPSSTSQRVNHEMRPIWPIIDSAMAELVEPISSLGISDVEYAILKLLCLSVEVPGMSRGGAEVVKTMSNKYLSLLSNAIQKSIGRADFSLAVARINQLLLLLPAAERVSQVSRSTLSLLSMFNYAGLQGQLTWELHVKQNGG
ncbi:nuclear receptor NHR-34, partial [Aphelenchoides avenae]